jgi:signal transduction histidine kinase
MATTDILDGAFSSPTARGFVEDVLESYGGAEIDFFSLARHGRRLARRRRQRRLGPVASSSPSGARRRGRARRTLRDDVRPKRLRVAIEEANRARARRFASASRGRRDRWLSYFSHEMRNSLNTLVNANWVIRNADGRPAAKICDMTDRAVKKLEDLVKGFRDLEAQVQKPAPGRADKV